jgi:tetratricopeptide (TPR) repeat protein
LNLNAQAQQLQIAQTSAQDYFNQGGMKVDSSLQEAIEDYTQAIRLNPDYAAAYYQRGRILSKLGDDQGAIKDYIKGLELDPFAYTPNREVAEEYIKSLQISPKDADAYYRRGLVRYSLKDTQGAIKDYNQAIRLNPNMAEAYVDRGLARPPSEHQQAIEDYNQAIQLNPNMAEAYYYRGRASNNVDDLTQAIRLDPNLAEAYLVRSLIKYRAQRGDVKMEDFTQVMEDFIQVVRLNANFFELEENQSMVYFERKATQNSLEKYNRAIQKNRVDADTFYNRGIIRLKLRDWQGAIDDFSQTIQINPQNWDIYYHRGLAHYWRKDYNRAVEDYTKAIQLNPNFLEAYANRALARYDAGDKQGAIADANEAIRRLDPSRVNAYIILSRALYDMGDRQKAITLYDQIICLLPFTFTNTRCTSNATVLASSIPTSEDYYNRGRALARRGDKRRAIENLQKAADLFLTQGNKTRYQEAIDLIRKLQQ